MKPNLIPERLIKAREALSLNKAQAAEAMGLSPIGYLRYEQGQRVPSAQMLRIIALTLNTSVGYLTGETDDPIADRILISRTENAPLFELATYLNSQDPSQAQRLLAYYQKLLKK